MLRRPHLYNSITFTLMILFAFSFTPTISPRPFTQLLSAPYLPTFLPRSLRQHDQLSRCNQLLLIDNARRKHDVIYTRPGNTCQLNQPRPSGFIDEGMVVVQVRSLGGMIGFTGCQSILLLLLLLLLPLGGVLGRGLGARESRWPFAKSEGGVNGSVWRYIWSLGGLVVLLLLSSLGMIVVVIAVVQRLGCFW